MQGYVKNNLFWMDPFHCHYHVFLYELQATYMYHIHLPVLLGPNKITGVFFSTKTIKFGCMRMKNTERKNTDFHL